MVVSSGRTSPIAIDSSDDEALDAIAAAKSPPELVDASVKQERWVAIDLAADAAAERDKEQDRVRVKRERRSAAAAAVEHGLEVRELVNLTDEIPPPPRFSSTADMKSCPGCGHACTYSGTRVAHPTFCGQGHCRVCELDFCWECGEALSRRPTRLSGSVHVCPRSVQH